MRWVSSEESMREGEPSVLAIAETLIAMVLTLWIAVHFGTVMHVVIGACIAPFLLLGTDESAALGIRVYKRSSEWFIELPLWAACILLLPMLLAFVPVRVFATIATVVRIPAAVLRAITGNWRQIALATDSCRSPKFFPVPDDPAVIRELEVDGHANDLYALIGAARPNLLIWSLTNLLFLPIIAILGLPPLLYRWSLKSTAVIWFPLLWALWPVGPSDKPLKARLKLFETSDLLRWVVLPVSGAALLLFAGKLILWNEIAQASNTWNASMLGRILTIHVAPGVIEWWHLATGLNSVIAIGLWLYVRSCLRHDEAGVPRRETVVERLLAWGLFVRRLLTSYTILCVGYLYVREAAAWELPPLGGNPFPWM